MTTYKEIKGTQIEVLESDPSNPIDGQVWYNSTDNVLKGNVGSPVASWATVTSLNQAREYSGGAGTSTAGLVFGGGNYPTFYALTEKYNGTNWTEVNDMNTARQTFSGVGTKTYIGRASWRKRV